MPRFSNAKRLCEPKAKPEGLDEGIVSRIFDVAEIAKFSRSEQQMLSSQWREMATEVSFTDAGDDVVVALMDGRMIAVPLVWFPRLLNVTPEQLENYELLGDGEGIHCPDVDEDLRVDGLLRGAH